MGTTTYSDTDRGPSAPAFPHPYGDPSDAARLRLGPPGAPSAHTERRPGVHAAPLALRALDVSLSATLLLLLLPVFAVIAVAVRLESPGPLIFRQKRVGKDGCEFPFLKFRSMIRDAEARRLGLENRNERGGPVFKIRDDPRVTRVGRVLRRWSLDELPQLINVLRGDMSLVGPRPALPSEVARYTPHQRRRLAVTPGVTGLWQVSGRARLSFEESVALDLAYIQRRSLALNLLILARTVPAVLNGDGAF